MSVSIPATRPLALLATSLLFLAACRGQPPLGVVATSPGADATGVLRDTDLELTPPTAPSPAPRWSSSP